MDCLFIHTPKFHNHYRPFGHFIGINSMPLGLLGLADHLVKHGFACRVLHQGVEWMNHHAWRLEDTLQAADPPLIALSLHWHHQAYDVIETCQRIRAIRPGARIVLGGFTASFFHQELVREYACLDAVVRGDAELPLLELVRRLTAGDQDLSGVPNLTWRNSQGEVIENPLTYCGTQEMLNGICFSNMELLHGYRTYVDHVTFPFIVVKRIPKELNYQAVTVRRKLFPITLGRGCPLNCTWCAGSLDPQREKISCRDKVVWRSYDAVMADIQKAMAYGYDAMYSVFDPQPQPQGQDYFLGLFQRIRAEGLAKRLGWMHEATGLTSREFADQFAETFSDDFRIIGLSPESGNEEVRRLNKGYFYSNQQLYEMLDYITQKDIGVEVFLTYGIPGENEDRLRDTVKMRDQIVKRYGRRARLLALSIEIEPGAPWQIEPKKFGIVTSRRTFRDFYGAHAPGARDSYPSLGYYIPDYFQKPLDARDPEGDFAERLQRLKCRRFCFIRPDARKSASPFWGRMYCRALRAARFLTGRDRKYAVD